jgi:hypothetical protein
MTTITAADAPTQELRVPPAVEQWRAEQGLPPIDASKFEHRQRPSRPGCHRLGEWHDLARLPAGWPFVIPGGDEELGDPGLYMDEFGVIRPVTSSKFRRHAARHTAVTP